MIENIRFAKAGDAGAILDIYLPYIMNSAITFETEEIGLSEFQKRMEDIQSSFPWLVYEEEGRVLGYAYATAYRERAAFAWDCECSVYVSEKAQRKGIASRLYQELFEQLRERGYYNVYAFITYPHNSSILLHKKFDFREVGVFHKTGFKLGKWWDLIVMEKSLREYNEEPEKLKAWKRNANQQIMT